MITSCVSRTTSRNPSLAATHHRINYLNILACLEFWYHQQIYGHHHNHHHQPSSSDKSVFSVCFGFSMFCLDCGVWTLHWVVGLWEFHCMIFTIVFALKLPCYNSLQRLSKLQADDCVVLCWRNYLKLFRLCLLAGKESFHTSYGIFI